MEKLINTHTKSEQEKIAANKAKAQAFLAKLRSNSEERPREAGYDGYRVREALSTRDKPTYQCPACKHMVNKTDTHGYTRNDQGITRVSALPCPVCAPPVRRHQRALQAAKYLRAIEGQLTPISQKERGYTFQSFRGNKDALELMEDFCTDEGIRDIYLFGKSGRGKTGLVRAAFAKLEAQGIDTLFLKSDKYLDLLRANFDARNGDTNHVEEITRGVPVLAVDDFGVGRFTEFSIAEFEKLIDERTSLGLRTVITSNFDLKQLYNVMCLDKFKGGFQPAERVISRLADYEKYQVVGSDMRG